jgi:hypothetical protein
MDYTVCFYHESVGTRNYHVPPHCGFNTRYTLGYTVINSILRHFIEKRPEVPKIGPVLHSQRMLERHIGVVPEDLGDKE